MKTELLNALSSGQWSDGFRTPFYTFLYLCKGVEEVARLFSHLF